MPFRVDVQELPEFVVCKEAFPAENPFNVSDNIRGRRKGVINKSACLEPGIISYHVRAIHYVVTGSSNTVARYNKS